MTIRRTKQSSSRPHAQAPSSAWKEPPFQPTYASVDVTELPICTEAECPGSKDGLASSGQPTSGVNTEDRYFPKIFLRPWIVRPDPSIDSDTATIAVTTNVHGCEAPTAHAVTELYMADLRTALAKHGDSHRFTDLDVMQLVDNTGKETAQGLELKSLLGRVGGTVAFFPAKFAGEGTIEA